MTTIVLADDHPIVRQGLRSLLENQRDFSVIGEADDGLATLAIVERLAPDVLILDLMMPGLNGLEVIARVRERAPRTKVIVLSMHSNEPYVLEALRNGANAYVLKVAATSSLLEAVRAVIEGSRYLSAPLTERAIDSYIRKAQETSDDLDSYKLLTAREREVFQLAAEGNTNAEISERLSISPRTAETHRTNIMRKLRLRSQVELVHYARDHNILTGD